MKRLFENSMTFVASWAALITIGLILPFVIPDYTLNTLILFFVWAVMAQSWNLVWGIAGIWSLGHMAIFTMGGYATGWLILHAELSPYAAAVFGVLAAVVVSVTMALPSLRLKGVYVILLTISFHEIFRILLATDTTGFTGGGFGLPHFEGFVPDDWEYQRKMRWQYYMGFTLFVVSSIGVWCLLRSRMGLAFRAIGQAPMYASSRGINLFATKVWAFVISGFLAGAAGAFYAQFFGTMQPGILAYNTLVTVLAMIAIGGWGSYAGPIAGAFFLIWVSEFLHEAHQFRMILLGGIIVFVCVVMPNGIISPITRFSVWLFHQFRDRTQEAGESKG